MIIYIINIYIMIFFEVTQSTAEREINIEHCYVISCQSKILLIIIFLNVIWRNTLYQYDYLHIYYIINRAMANNLFILIHGTFRLYWFKTVQYIFWILETNTSHASWNVNKHAIFRINIFGKALFQCCYWLTQGFILSEFKVMFLAVLLTINTFHWLTSIIIELSN